MKRGACQTGFERIELNRAVAGAFKFSYFPEGPTPSLQSAEELGSRIFLYAFAVYVYGQLFIKD
jgi:hypothetical protein